MQEIQVMAFPIKLVHQSVPAHIKIKWLHSRNNWISYVQPIYFLTIEIKSDDPDAVAQFQRQLEPILKRCIIRQVGVGVDGNHVFGENRHKVERVARQAIIKYFWKYGRCDFRVTMTI